MAKLFGEDIYEKWDGISYEQSIMDDEMMSCSDSVIDPLLTVMNEGGPFHTIVHLDDYLKRLRETGREEGAKELERSHKKTL